MFLKATNNKFLSLYFIDYYSKASCMHLHFSKSSLIDINAYDFYHLIWHGKRIPKETIFRHLGFPVGVLVSNKNLIHWVLEKIKKKISFGKCTESPLHVRLRIVQSILILYILYYILLLDWKKGHFTHFITLIRNYL